MRKFVLFFFLTACTKMCSKPHSEMGAEEVLEAYLNIALNMERQEQKYDLMEYTTAELKTVLAGADEETIGEAYIDKRYSIEKFSIVERKDLSPREIQLTFHLQYKEKQAHEPTNKQSATITTESSVILLKENEKWYIAEVAGNKTNFDFPLGESE